MGDEHHRGPAGEFGGQVLQAHAGERVQRREGLVHEQHRPILHEGAQQGRALAHAAGERGRQGLLAAGEVGGVEQVTGPGAPGVVHLAAQPRPEQDVVEQAEPGQEQVVLAHPGHHPRSGRVGFEADPAGGGQGHAAGDQLEQGRLAAAARAEQAGGAAGAKAQREIGEQRPTLELQADPVDDNGRGGRGRGRGQRVRRNGRNGAPGRCRGRSRRRRRPGWRR